MIRAHNAWALQRPMNNDTASPIMGNPCERRRKIHGFGKNNSIWLAWIAVPHWHITWKKRMAIMLGLISNERSRQIERNKTMKVIMTRNQFTITKTLNFSIREATLVSVFHSWLKNFPLLFSTTNLILHALKSKISFWGILAANPDAL